VRGVKQRAWSARLILAALALGLLSISGCAAGSAVERARAKTTVHPSKVLVVIEENHSYDQMKSGMPYLFGLSQKYGYASHWSAITHPSLPNYLAIAGGSTFGVADDRDPAVHSANVGSARSVFDQALDVGKTARTYAESMPTHCSLKSYPPGAPTYAVRHNPWTYFGGSRSRCRSNDVPLSGFAQAARSSSLPNVGFLIPNLCDDAHSCSLTRADAFLKKTLPDVLSSRDFTSGRLVVVVTADEDNKLSHNAVLTSVLSTRLSHKVVTTPLSHYSLTRYLAQVLGVTPLRNARSAPDMRAAFGL
jgi:phosphatidylinositol-3-phosphatase